MNQILAKLTSTEVDSGFCSLAFDVSTIMAISAVKCVNATAAAAPNEEI